MWPTLYDRNLITSHRITFLIRIFNIYSAPIRISKRILSYLNKGPTSTSYPRSENPDAITFAPLSWPGVQHRGSIEGSVSKDRGPKHHCIEWRIMSLAHYLVKLLRKSVAGNAFWTATQTLHSMCVGVCVFASPSCPILATRIRGLRPTRTENAFTSSNTLLYSSFAKTAFMDDLYAPERRGDSGEWGWGEAWDGRGEGGYERGRKGMRDKIKGRSNAL